MSLVDLSLTESSVTRSVLCLHYSPKHDCITFRIGEEYVGVTEKFKMDKISVNISGRLRCLVVLMVIKFSQHILIGEYGTKKRSLQGHTRLLEAVLPFNL